MLKSAQISDEMIPKFFAPLSFISSMIELYLHLYSYLLVPVEWKMGEEGFQTSWMTAGSTGAIPTVAEGEGSTRFCYAHFK